ncbi:MAG: hypothetical protein OHK0044_15500 [Burkholderiaceae bacterium]
MPRDGLPQATRDNDDLAGCLPRGYRLNEFVIDRVIAEGGFGVVYAALDLRLKRRVAIKEYMPALLARRAGDFSVQPRSSVRHQDAFAVGLKSFINEARLLAQFDHPSLVRVHQFWEDKGTGFIVMPLYQGPTLKQWLAANPPPDEAWLRAFLHRMLDALALLHAAGCLHRDVAPDNILVLEDGAPLLLDFGAARRVVDALAQSLTVIVKPGYAPIEQYADVAGLKQGPWTDLYALCATAHTIIVRQPPPPAVARTVHDEMTPLSEAAFGRYSHALLAALDAGLAVRPEHRPPSVDVLRALIAAGDADAAERTVLLAPDANEPPSRSRDIAPNAAAPAPRESRTAAAPAATADTPRAMPVSTAAAPADARASARRLPAAFERRNAVREWLFERPLGAREVALAIAATLIGIGAIAAQVLHAPEQPSGTAAVLEAQVRPITVAPTVAPQTRAPVATADATSQTPAAPAVPAPALERTEPSAVVSSEAAPDRAESAVPIASAPAPAAPRAVAAPKPRVGAATAPPRSPIAAESRAPVPTGARPPAAHSAALREAAASGEAVAARANASRAVAPVDEPPAVDRRVATVDAAAAASVPASSEAPTPPGDAAPPPRATLVPIAQPRPTFSVEAARDGITHGRVLARLSVDADGRVKGVRVLESAPRRAFDREVRQAALRWRYQPPGEPREVDVEFLFRLES